MLVSSLLFVVTPMNLSTENLCARIIFNSFTAYFANFQNITLSAQQLFEQANWRFIGKVTDKRKEL